MARFGIAILIALGAAAAGCDRSSGPPAATSSQGTSAKAATRGSAGHVDRTLIEGCAGFNVETAAGILGVPPAALNAQTRWSKDLGAQTCRYWSPDSLIGPGVQFVLEAEESPSAAAASLASMRRNAPAGDAAIRDVVGQPKAGAPLIELEGAGDEAIWDALTTGVTLRVGNVVARIQASGSRQLSSEKEGTEIELERRVAVEVARGLRGGRPSE